ncbi:MAG: carboxymuconolactone decarboxylase family protein [Rhodospirillales bacterium]
MNSTDKPAREQRIPPYEIGSGIARSDAALEAISKMFGGYVPNLHRVLARSPAMIEAFEAMRRLLQGTKISALERELVAIEVSRRSGCDYCMTAHTYFADRMKLERDDLRRAEAGKPLTSDSRLALVQRATQRLLDRKGRLSDAELAEFKAAGLGEDELIEIIGIIGWYVMSTYTNNLAQTEIDGFFMPGGKKV